MADSFAGDVVRIAPNELVFITPEAAKGQTKRHEPLIWIL
jgi:hypothetical protein